MPKELSAKNFSLSRLPKQSEEILTLNTNGEGYTLVFFRGEQCKGCRMFAPIFDQLEQKYGGQELVFARIDVELHRSVIQMSRKTKTIISHVPYLILFSGKNPFIKYTGNLSLVSLESFLQKVFSQYAQPNQRATFTPTNDMVSSHNSQKPRGGPGGYVTMGGHEDVEEDSNILLCPTHVIPHNAPWEGAYKKLGLEID